MKQQALTLKVCHLHAHLSIFYTLWTAGETWKVPFGYRTLRLDVRLLRPSKIEDDVAMETAGAAVAYGVPCR